MYGKKTSDTLNTCISTKFMGGICFEILKSSLSLSFMDHTVY